jgi:uncharacterized protein YecE (DUF72 family)
MAELRIGTCSWKYPSWKGLVYSRGSGINYLEEYARKYETVEVDQWFWSLFGEDSVRLPSPADVESYSRSVPKDFKFTIKVPNSVTLTHFYSKGRQGPLRPNPHFLSREVFEGFLSRLKPLKGGTGPLMFQFEYLNKQKMASARQFREQMAEFADGLPKTFQYALETRNGNYLNDSYFRFLLENGLVPVLLQGYWMPQITEVYRKWGGRIRDHGAVIIRLQGADRKGIEERSGEKWNAVVDSKDDELPGIVEMIEELLDADTDVYVNVNNHYEGSAPLTIEKIKTLLGHR